MQTLKDPLTGREFSPRRKNQRFASARNRIDFNNQKATAERTTKAFIDRPLQVNHRILMELIGPGETKTIPKSLLIEKGYNLSVMSHYVVHEDKQLPALYNFTLFDLGDNKPTLTVKRTK